MFSAAQVGVMAMLYLEDLLSGGCCSLMPSTPHSNSTCSESIADNFSVAARVTGGGKPEKLKEITHTMYLLSCYRCAFVGVLS
jgi:hypothetical protein